MKTKFTIKSLLILAFTLFSFSNILAQACNNRALIISGPQAQAGVSQQYTITNGNPVGHYGWHVQGGTFTDDGSTIKKISGINSVQIIWNCNDSGELASINVAEYGSENDLAFEQNAIGCNTIAFGSISDCDCQQQVLGFIANTIGLNSPQQQLCDAVLGLTAANGLFPACTNFGINYNNTFCPSCNSLQTQIDTIFSNTSLTNIQKLDQVRAIVVANPDCDFTLCN